MPISMTPETIEDALEWLRKAFDSEAARRESVRYQIDLGGEAGADLWLDVRDGLLELGRGRIGGPDVTFRVCEADFLALLAGRQNPDLLFMEDRLEIEGELALALKLRKLFRTPV